MRGLLLTTTLMATVFAQALPLQVPSEFDLVKYGITQGGLVIVILVLLWSYRRDFLRIMGHDDDKISVLTELVNRSTTAVEKQIAVGEANEKAIHRLARALEDRR